jgi:hypothetical protein
MTPESLRDELPFYVRIGDSLYRSGGGPTVENINPAGAHIILVNQMTFPDRFRIRFYQPGVHRRGPTSSRTHQFILLSGLITYCCSTVTFHFISENFLIFSFLLHNGKYYHNIIPGVICKPATTSGRTSVGYRASAFTTVDC